MSLKVLSVTACVPLPPVMGSRTYDPAVPDLDPFALAVCLGMARRAAGREVVGSFVVIVASVGSFEPYYRLPVASQCELALAALPELGEPPLARNLGQLSLGVARRHRLGLPAPLLHD